MEAGSAAAVRAVYAEFLFSQTHSVMKRFGFLAYALLAGWGVASAAPVPLKGSVKNVKVYPQGIYVSMSVPVSLAGGAQEEIVFPDLWYADPATVELKLMPGVQGVDYVMESQRAMRGSDVEMQRDNLLRRDSLLARKARLEADSMVLSREIEFLQANARQEATTVAQLAAADGWMRDRYAKVYEAQRKNSEARTALGKELADNERLIRWVNSQVSHVTLVRARVNSPGARKAEFELSYFSNAAQWRPVYFFRFEPGKSSAELDYRATVKQSTNFDWIGVPATLSYGTPMRSLNRPKLYPRTVSYAAPAPKVAKQNKLHILDLDVTQDLAVDVARFGGTYTAEDAPQAAMYAAPAAVLDVTENHVGYRLARPLTLVSSSDGGQVQQTVQVRRDTIPVLYEYEVAPKVSGDVLLLARVPGWRQLHLMDGRMNVFCDGRMLGQSNLSVRSTQDTLVLPLTFEQQVVVDRLEAGDYKERVSGSKMERSREYEIRIRNNREYPVNLTVKDQYPVSGTDEVEVVLTESSGATVDTNTGMLTWKLELAPGAERILKFGYAVRYPKGGTVYF